MDAACGCRWGTLTPWPADALRADTDQREEEKTKKKCTCVLRKDLCMRAGEVDVFVLGRALRV